MAANSPFLRPLAIAAGGLGTVQATIWGILSLLGILAYSDVMKDQSSDIASNQFQKMLVAMYFNSTGINKSTATQWHIYFKFKDLNIMTPGSVVVWTSIYFATSVIWIVISSFLLYESYNYKLTSKIIIGWVAVSGIVAAIDFAGTVTFGVDYGKLKSGLDSSQDFRNVPATDILLVPLFMMLMCARGFILWIINVALVIYLGVAASNLHKKGSPNLLKNPDYLSRHPSFNNSMGANMYSSPTAHSLSQGRQNTAFQPDATFGWNTQSPTVGNQQPSQRDITQRNAFHQHGVVNPIRPIPRAGKPLPIPVDPLPTPQPDYSPPTRRQKHEPNMYEAPARSVLKKSNSQRQSYF